MLSLKMPALLMLTLVSVSHAELKPIEDNELSEYTGQLGFMPESVLGKERFIELDTKTIGDLTYSRVSYDMDLTTTTSIGNITAKWEETPEQGPVTMLDIDNFALGSVSTNEYEVQLNGKTYAVGKVVPFEVFDPYFETVEDASGALGIRVGFGGARGKLSGDFNEISGNVGATITDLNGNTYDAELLNELGNQQSTNTHYFGVSNANSGGVTDCNTGSYCYDLHEYKTFDIGQQNMETGQVDPSSDFFLSFQKQAIDWETSGGTVSSDIGAFINIPAMLNIDMGSNTNTMGVPRVRTGYSTEHDLF